MNIKTILDNLFGSVMCDGKRIPGSRVLVFGTRIFLENYLTPNDTIICTDYADWISLHMRGEYKHIEFIPESIIKRWLGYMEDGKFAKRLREKVYNYIERKYEVTKFGLIVTNPPYGGTTMDNTYGKASDYSASLIEKYGNLKVEDVVYDDAFRMSFGNATINSGLGIFTYSKKATHNLFDDFIREKRFGKRNWDMRKSIIGKSVFTNKRISGDDEFGWEGIQNFNGVVISKPKPRGEEIARIQNELGYDKNIVVMPFIAGSVNKKTGNHNFDWCAVQTKRCLLIQKKLENLAQFFIPYDDKLSAKNLIKWLNTDFVMYIVNHYKKNVTNSVVLFKLIPQPPALDGNYSDEVLMKHFNLTQEEMDWIHSEMKDFGWKVNLGKTESELMAYIDEINK